MKIKITKEAKVSQYTEEAEHCNGNTSASKIFKEGYHVGWRTKYWTLGVSDSFEVRKILTKSDIDNLRKKYPWVTGTEDEDGCWLAGCDSYFRLSILLDILSGNAPINAAIS